MLGALVFLAAYPYALRRPVGDTSRQILTVYFVVYAVAVGTSHAIVMQHIVSDLSIWTLALALVAVALPIPGRTRIVLYWTSLVVVVVGTLGIGVPQEQFISLLTNATSVAVIVTMFDHVTTGQARDRYAARREAAYERTRAEELLLNMLPAPIARRLKEGESSIADGHSEATILFADIGGFTALAALLPPGHVVRLLDELFSTFDGFVERHGVEKIKTIGDAYMAAAGLPERDERHAVRIANVALDMRDHMVEFNRTHGTTLTLRIGMHSGYVVAGVIGRKRFLYDLWGESVNLASRMERHGVPGEIQVTATTRELLKREFELAPRGEIDLKGLGSMPVFLLAGPKTQPGFSDGTRGSGREPPGSPP